MAHTTAKEGCYCHVNDLLRDIIGTLTGSFDAVVLDGEAGIEQINRRVLERVTHLLAISDASARGINVARTIQDVARAAVHSEKAGLILNRIRGEDELRKVAIPAELTLLGWVPEDEAVRDAGIHGTCLLDLPDGGFLAAVRACLARIGIPLEAPAAGPGATTQPGRHQHVH